MIQLVVCDMDGTMVGPDERLPEEAPRLIRALEEQGVLFTVATGRAEGYMVERVAKLSLKLPYLATNGATLIQDGRAILRKTFPIRLLRDAAAQAEALGMSLIYTFEGEERVTQATDWLRHEGDKQGYHYTAQPFSATEWETLRADKVLIMDPARKGDIQLVEDALQAIRAGGAIAYVRYRDKAIEVTEGTADKATGLVALTDRLGIPLANTLMIGDDNNDLRAFRTAGESAAVGNASDAVKVHATYVCTACRFEGVKEAVAHFCGVRL